MEMPRRDFLKTVPATVGFLHASGRAAWASRPAADIRLHPFDYQGARLLDSRWSEQARAGRDYYFGLTNDNILAGFRAEAGLPAPGSNPVRGWGIQPTPGAIFGQWLSGMSRLQRATGDAELRQKAADLLDGWTRTLPASGGPEMSHYQFDKMTCGLVDLYLYAGVDEAIPVLQRLADHGSATLNRDRIPASADRFFGSPNEWYTLSENLYRAFQVTGDERFKSFAEVWLYEPYWSRFADTSSPPDVHGVHAYSHVNTFSSAAMHYEITGDPKYLRVIRNAYDYLQDSQCYATGGFGPDERFLDPNGGLGRALEIRPNTFETVCGSWAGFKLSRYLQRFTGEARYGDWAERLLYNGVGAALRITTNGRNFYYADYRTTGGMKVYRYDNYTCCSGSYFQCMADYHNLIYYRDEEGLYVNLYVPSEVAWNRGGAEVRVRQETEYPIEDVTTLTVETSASVAFPLRVRVPGWCEGMSIRVNGSAVNLQITPGTWATISRTWDPGDRVEVTIPQSFRWQAVDGQHPERAAIVRGAVVMPLEFRYLEPSFSPPRTDEELNEWLTPDMGDEVVKALSSRGAYLVPGKNGRPLAAKFRPFYQYTENYPYLMYMDRDKWPTRLW